MLNLPDLLRVPNVDSGLKFDISPDGRRLVFSWNRTGRWELYELPLLEGGAEVHPLAMTADIEGAKFSPHFSPDGDHLAYALDPDGSESYHIIIHDLGTGISRDLTPRIAYAHQPNMAWSPDGMMLAVLSDRHGQFALHLLPVDGTPGRMIKNVFQPCWDVAWSPDSQWIAIESEGAACDRSIHVMPVNRPRKATKVNTVELKLNAQHPAWSPDSKFLAFSGQNGEWLDIGLFNAATQQITWVNESTGDDTQPAWSRSGDTLGWVHADGARTSFQFKRGGGPVCTQKIGDGVHSFPHFSSDGLVILYEDPGRPCDLWRMAPEEGTFEQLTNSLPEDLRGVEFIHPVEILYAGKDGTQVPALLYRANDSSRAVLDIHGGPNWNLQFSWNPVLACLAAQGWTVLAPNYRGSTGYGRTWQRASRYDMGGVDTDDCAAGAKYLTENNLAQKVAVTGRSHGGYLTMTCLTMYPELFAGGSAVVPFLNWIKSHKNSREDLQHWNIENMGDPEDNHQLWLDRSPYFHLERVNAPVQLICGGKDPRCPASDSIDARDKLVELGRKVELLLYRDEGHTFLNIGNVLDAELKRVEFLARILK